MSTDFAHHLPIGAIRDGTLVEVAADPAERKRIAQRFGLPSLERLEAHVRLERDGSDIRARGRVQASLEQSCVVTGEPVAALVDEPFEIIFLPEPSGDRPDHEIELGEADCDIVFHDGSAIDLGAAIEDTLALALEPYPRTAGADAALKEAGVLSEEDAGPFAALAKLRQGDGNR